MSAWPSTRAPRVLGALLRIGWVVKRQSGSHRTLSRPGWGDFVFAFHEDDPVALTFWDPDHSEEEREITIGRSTRQRVRFVAHGAREGHVRVISARRATRQEQRQYEERIGEAT